MSYLRVAAISPQVFLCDPEANAAEILACLDMAEEDGAGIALLPKRCLTGYTAGDMLCQPLLYEKQLSALTKIRKWSEGKKLCVVLGLTLATSEGLKDAAAVVLGGDILGLYSGEHSRTESAYLDGHETLSADCIFESEGGESFGIALSDSEAGALQEATRLSGAGAKLILHLQSAPDTVLREEENTGFIEALSRALSLGFVSLYPGSGESVTDGVYSGSCIFYECGEILKMGEGFVSESSIDYADFDLDRIAFRKRKGLANSCHGGGEESMLRLSLPELKSVEDEEIERQYERDAFGLRIEGELIEWRCERAFSMQKEALARRMKHIRAKKAVLGVSGGLDSTLALLVACEAAEKCGLSRKDVIAITLPGFGTSRKTRSNADILMERLGVDMRDISIVPATLQHFKDIGHGEDVFDSAYENAQARERTKILMDIANMENGLVVGTGDMSEEALGWCTYNGDHMAMYNVNSGIPKTAVRSITEWYGKCRTEDEELAEALRDILNTPVSPELLPPEKDGSISQKTEEKLGAYELHDFFLYHTIKDGMKPKKLLAIAKNTFTEYEGDEIKNTLKTFYKRFFSQQFKRSCAPDGVQIFDISLSPRGGLSMPSDALSSAWLKELETPEN